MSSKAKQYDQIKARIHALLRGETDEVAMMATVACELYHELEHVDWAGFYRVVTPGLLKVGPYQGGHGCLEISFDRGVCGKCARERVTQLVEDVSQFPYHIACSSATRSEIVVPVVDAGARLRAVLDLDSDSVAAFDAEDQARLESLCRWLGERWPLGKR